MGGACSSRLRCLCHWDLCGVEHILDEDTVARGGVVDEHVGDSTDELTVLNDGRARHSLNDPSRFGKECFVGYLDGKAFIGSGISLDLGNSDVIFLGGVAFQGTPDGGVSFLDLVTQTDGDRLAFGAVFG